MRFLEIRDSGNLCAYLDRSLSGGLCVMYQAQIVSLSHVKLTGSFSSDTEIWDNGTGVFS